MTMIRKLLTVCCLLFIAVGLVACDQQMPVETENQQEEAENETLHRQRLKAFDLPSDFAKGIHPMGEFSDSNVPAAKIEGRKKLSEISSPPLQSSDQVRSRAPSDYDISNSPKTNAPVERISEGRAALPPSSVEKTSLNETSSSSTITKDNTVQASEGTKSYSRSGGHD